MKLLPAERRRPQRIGRLARVNREPTTGAVRFIAPILHRFLPMWTSRSWLGAEHLPPSGPAIVVANHISNLDPPLLAESLAYQGRYPHFLAKSSLFMVPVLGRLLRWAEQIPVLRGSSQARDALVHAEAALAAGQVVVIYPEGTITFDPHEWPMAAHTGAARLALRTGAPVIPVGQWGANMALPPRKIRKFQLRRWPITIIYGAPVDLSEFGGAWADREVARAATLKIMAAITALTAQARGEQPPDQRWHQRRNTHVAPAEAIV